MTLPLSTSFIREHPVNMCFIKCGAQSLGAVLEGQKVMYLSHGRVPYQTALFNDTILLHILYGSHVHILNKNYQNVYALILHVSYHIQYLFIYIFIDCKGIKHLHVLILCVSYQYLSDIWTFWAFKYFIRVSFEMVSKQSF